MQLQERVVSIPQAIEKHQALLLEFEQLKPFLDVLRSKGGDIIRHSSEPEEKHKVQKALADINRQWLNLQSQTADHTQELSEAADLSHAIDDVANGLQEWLDHAETLVGVELNLFSFEKIKDHLKAHRRVQKELDSNQDKVIALNAMVKQLEQFCESPANMVRVNDLKQRVDDIQTHTDVQLSSLEDANKKIEEFEKEVNELMKWIEKTRARMTMRDTTTDLRNQLAVQERLYEDVLKNKARAEEVVASNPDPSYGHVPPDNSTGETTLTPAGRLVSEMGLLETAAKEQLESLELAVSQQERYAAQIRQLNQTISEAQQKLQASPVTATSVGALKQQMTERNRLAEQIKQSQANVNVVHEKNRQLILDSAMLSPSVFRKHYLPESAYSDYFSAAAQHQRGSSPLPSSSHLFYETLPTFSFDTPLLSDAPPTFRDMTQMASEGEPTLVAPPMGSATHLNDFELPRKIPPPKTDSIPRPTWSESIPSTSGEKTEASGLVSLTQSIDSPRTTARSFDSKSSLSYSTPPAVKSVVAETVSTKSGSRYLSSADVPESGIKVSLNTSGDSGSVDSGLDASVAISSSNLSQTLGDSLPSVNLGPENRDSKSSDGQSNVLWNALQEQVQSKERMLQEAIQRQETYQHLVQDLTTKMERAYIRLAESPASQAAQLDTQMREYQETLKEIENIKSDINKVKEWGDKLISSPDSESYKTMNATLAMLTDRFHNLETMAEDKGKQLQDARNSKEKHTIAKKAYTKRVEELRSWMEEMKVRQSSLTLPSDDLDTIKIQLDDNRDMQEEINNHLCQMSDLALQCDRLCEQEHPEQAEKLRTQLATLQNDLIQFKSMTIEKQNHLRTVIRETEKRQKELELQESTIQGLQRRMDEMKDLSYSSITHTAGIESSQKDNHKELATDLKSHKDLVQQISVQHVRTPVPSARQVTVSDKEVRQGWERLSQDLAHKNQSLEAILRTKKPGELLKSSYGTLRQEDITRQLEDVRGVVRELSDHWNVLQKKLGVQHLELDDALTFQQQYQSALQNVSNCLDQAQQQLFTVPTTTEEHIRQNEGLQKQLNSLQREIAAMNQQAEDLFLSTNYANQDLIENCLDSLQDRVKLLHGAAESQSGDLHSTERQWRQYQSEVTLLQQRLQDTQKLILAPNSTLSLEELMVNNQQIEAALKKCENQLHELKGKELSLGHPKGSYQSDLSNLQTYYMELHRRALERKSVLQNSITVQDQYQKMLSDYAAFLETAQDKVNLDSISARDLNHLKQQLTAHKDFFSDLEVHKAMLDSLASQCDPVTRSKFQQKHSSLSSITAVLVDQASLHGHRLERLTRQWTDLEEKYTRLIKVLSSLESKVPQPIVSGDSLTTIQDKLSRYKTLQTELADAKNTVFEVVDKGKQILHSINCPSLETDITDLAEKWVSLNTDLSYELKRTATLGDQLSTFETDATILSSWLKAAKMKLTSFKKLSQSDLQNIGAVRTKVEKVLEFRKEVENQVPLKERVISVGNKLLQNKNYDTRGLSDRLNGYEEEWKQLEQGISETEQFLHQAQMDLMPSRQALNELVTWVEEINKSLAQDAQRRITSLADIEVMVKKYKGYKIELNSKQMTLDFVNQSVLAPQPDEVDVPQEKLEFADKLGQLNRQWKGVVKSITDRLNALEGTFNKWDEFEKSLDRLHVWFREQEDNIKRYKLIGHEFGVKHTLTDCKAIQQQLKAKTEDLKTLRALGNHLIEISRDSPGCQQSVRDSLAGVDQKWKKLEEQTKLLENLLSDMSGQWARYHEDLASLNQLLTQTEYALNHYNLIGGDIGTLRSQVAKLQALKRDLDSSAGNLDMFSALAGQLRQVCEPPVQLEIQKNLADVQTKWKQLSADLAVRCVQFEQCLGQWERFEDQFNRIRDWLDTKEAICTELISMRDDPMRRAASLEKCKKIQAELDSYQSQVSDLCRLSDQVTRNMAPSTISIITSRQSAIEQRMLGLRQILEQHKTALTEDISMLGQFNKAFEVVQKFLSYAEQILASEDPSRSAEEDVLQMRLDALKQLTLLFNTNYSKLDTVNDLGYRLALNEADATRLRELNHRWQRLYEDANDRSRILQGHLLVQQDFASKCQTWMTFLAQTEQDLAKEVKGNLIDLREQLHCCERFESETYSRQQILHAIISDGQKMMRAGEVEDREDFQRKLHLLAEQWQSVSSRANQRRALIESLINQWQQFTSLSQQLTEWLQQKDEAIRACELESDSLQVIRNLVEKVKTTQHEFKLQEASYNKIHDLGSVLLQHADFTEAEKIRSTLSDLKARWHKVFGQLDNHKSRLEDVDRQWLHCEDDIEDILSWLRDIRHALNADIPTTYDELQAEINRCRDISIDFANSEDKRQRLLLKEKQLSRMVPKEDMNLLHQRIRLLIKQWGELQHQTQLREQRLTEALYRWTNVGERIRALLRWIEDMEIKVMSNQDMQVEDLLALLENEYKLELEKQELEKADIVAQGKALMKVSSEIRASDIEQKLLRLEDKWEHLQAVMEYRHRKLQETVLAVRQLDTSMKNLSQWLTTVENELSSGIAFKDTNVREIQGKLEANQELQDEIQCHSAGVSAVLNLCEVLLHDSDACPTESEFTALQHAMKNLEKRWRNICVLSPQRRTRLEETWQLWDIFRQDCQRFSDWLTQAEINVRDSEHDVSNIKVAKKKIRKYEELQRRVLDHLSDLEHINRQYCQLAKEGRTDSDGSLKVRMTDLNNRWDALQLRVTEIMKRLRDSASIREDFETTRASLIAWLNDVELQLTSLQNMSGSDLDTKVIELRRIEDEIHTKRHRMEYLNQAAVYLIQKGDSQQALHVQHELDDFRAFSKKILERVVTTKLYIERLLVAQRDIPTNTLDRDEGRYYFQSAADRIRELKDAQSALRIERQTEQVERFPSEAPALKYKRESSPSKVSLSPVRRTSSPIRRPGSPVQRSQSPSPIRSRSPTRRAVSPSKFAMTPLRRVSPSPHKYTPAPRSPSPEERDSVDGRASPRLDISRHEKTTKIDILYEELMESVDDCNIKLTELENNMAIYGNSEQSLQLLLECEVAVDKVDRLDRLLKIEMGQDSIPGTDNQVKFVKQRWETLKTRAVDQDYRISQNLVQFTNDLDKILAWLDEAEALQSTFQPLPVDIDQINLIIRKFMDFTVQLESKKALISSINLLSRNFLISKNTSSHQLRFKLQEMNRRWERVLSRAAETERALRISLIQCQEYHHQIHDYQLWLDEIEAKLHSCEPIHSGGTQILWTKYNTLLDLYDDLQRNQSTILSLKETADRLLTTTDSPEMSTARDKIHIISGRMRYDLHLAAGYIASLEEKLHGVQKGRSTASSFDEGLGSSRTSRSSTPLQIGPSSARTRSPFAISRKPLAGTTGPLLLSGTQDRDNLSTESESSTEVFSYTVRPFPLMRIICAALPIHLLLLLFLLFAFLIPVCEDEYSCLSQNNLRNSFSPMLHYTDGAPPI
ncbi:unnamed protein product [Lymnaea stagnalis]|uniref:KASH domain-containing protein n=1 Tax=Lymnaea stagnalis TaxID=6523 RepID=A0AAV2IDD6_LYMST